MTAFLHCTKAGKNAHQSTNVNVLGKGKKLSDQSLALFSLLFLWKRLVKVVEAVEAVEA